jgi:hypothetical protein
MSDLVELKGPDGKTARFTREDAAAMADHGWTVPGTTSDIASEYPLTAGILGAARGATFGLSDILAKTLGADPEAINALRAANPVASSVGNVAGGMATGAGILGKLGLTSIGAITGASGVMGALTGAGQETADQLLANKPLRAEEIALEAGKGALWGVGGALAGAGIGKAVSGIAGKLTASATANADKQAMDAVSKLASKKMLMRLDNNPENMQALGKQLIEEGALSGGAADALEANTARLKDLGARIEDFHATTANSIAPETVTELTSNLRALAEPGDMAVRAPAWSKRLRLLADNIEDRAGINGEELTTRDLHAARKQIDNLLQPFGPTKPAPKELFQARAAISEELHAAMPEEFRQVSTEYGSRKDLGKMLDQARYLELKGELKPAGLMDFIKPKLTTAAGAAALGHPHLAAGVLATGVGEYLGPAVKQAMGQAGASAIVQVAAQKNAAAIATGIGALLGDQAARPSGPSISDYDKAVDEVKQAAENPSLATAKVTSAIGADLHQHLPEVADNASATALRGLQALHAAIPKSSLPPALLSGEWRPTKAQQAEWLQAYQAVVNPHSVLANPTPAGMAMVRQVYPALAQEFQAKLLAAMQDKKVPYQTQLKLSKILGTGVSTLTDPALVATAQQTLAPPPEGADNQKGSARTAGASRAKERKLNFDKTAKAEQTQITRFLEKE